MDKFWLIASIFIAYFLIIQIRKVRLVFVAKKIGLMCDSSNIFSIGKISGVWEDRYVEIFIKKGGDIIAHDQHMVFYKIGCENKEMRLIIKNNFFKKFPQWKHVYKVVENANIDDLIRAVVKIQYNSTLLRGDSLSNEQKEYVEKFFLRIPFSVNEIRNRMDKILSTPSVLIFHNNCIVLGVRGLDLSENVIEANLRMICLLSEELESEEGIGEEGFCKA